MLPWSYSRDVDQPKQRVSYATRQTVQWYEPCIDWVIMQGITHSNKREFERLRAIQRGQIPQEDYAKTLDPYNVRGSEKPADVQNKLLRYPATMRNLDIMSDSIRRYVSEYTKAVHEFVVVTGKPEVAFDRDEELKSAIVVAARQAFMLEFQNAINAAMAEGQRPEQIDVNSIMPSPEEFLKKFEKDAIDTMAIDAQQLLDVIDTVLQTDLIYAEVYLQYIMYGECYTYHTIRNNKLVLECVPIEEAYPVHSKAFFTQQDDMFARKEYMTYNQILDRYDDDLSVKDRAWLDKYYSKGFTSAPVHWYDVVRDMPERCEKYPTTDRELFENDQEDIYGSGGGLYEHWTVNWRGWAKAIIVTRVVNGIYMQDVEPETYKFDPMSGDVMMKYKWIPCIYEGVRIGNDKYGIYPIKARPIQYANDQNLLFNGIHEVIRGLGKFSIIKTIAPLQIFRNIIGYHMEMTIARNNLSVLVMAKSLLGKDPDDTMYRMEASGIMYYDDSIDSASAKAHEIRMVTASTMDYIGKLAEIMDMLKNEGREMVDMTPQRYGDIATSAGKATTEEAIMRGSMGSVILVFMFDKMREADYQNCIECTKIAWADGFDTHYMDKNDQPRYFSLDVNEHLARDYQCMVKNSAKETEKRDQLRSWAFNAGQNGEFEIAAEALQSNSTPELVRAIKAFGDVKREHEKDLEKLTQQTNEMLQQYELQKIEAQGAQDKEIEYIKGMIAAGQQAAEIEAKLFELAASTDEGTPKDTGNSSSDGAKLAMQERIEKAKLLIEARKLAAANFNAEADRQIELLKMKNDLKIAVTNKNKYDKPKTTAKKK